MCGVQHRQRAFSCNSATPFVRLSDQYAKASLSKSRQDNLRLSEPARLYCGNRSYRRIHPLRWRVDEPIGYRIPKAFTNSGFRVITLPNLVITENERLMERAMFRQVRARDTTESAARIAKQWYQARKKREDELIAAEGNTNFEGLQRFLSCVHLLMSEKRLLRHLYVATSGPPSDIAP